MADVARGSVLLTPKFDNLTSSIEKQLTGAFSSSTSIGSRAGASTGQAYAGGLSAKAGAVMGLVSSVTQRAFDSIASSLDSAISRVDTMNNFPRVMSGLGYSADDASSAIQKMSDHLTGLPTKLDAMTSSVQKIVPTVKDVGKATDIMLAFNDALLAGGASTQVQEAALEQFSQVLAKGKPELEDWRSIVTAMPGQMDQVAKSILGASASSTDLYNAMKSGKVTVEQLEDAFVSLDKEGYEGFDSFSQQAINGTNGIATSFSNMRNAVTKDVAKVLDAVGTDFIAGRIQASTRRISEMGDVAADVVTKVKDWLAELYAKVQENGALETFRGVVQRVADALGKVTAKVPDWSSALPPQAAADALKRVADALADVSDWVSQHSDAVVAGLAAVAGALAAFKATKGLVAAADYLGRLSAAMTIVGGAANAGGNGVKALDGLMPSLAGSSIGAVGGVARLYAGLKDLKYNAALAGGGVKGLWSTLGAGKWAFVVGGVAAVVGALAVFFTKTDTGRQLWGQFTDFLAQAWDKVQGAWQAAQPVLEGVLSAIGQGVSDFAQGALPVLQGFADAAGGFFQGVAEAVGQFLSPILANLPALGEAFGNLGQALGDALAQLQPLLGQLGQAFQDAFAECAPAFQQLGESFAQLAAALAPALAAIVDLVGLLAPVLIELAGTVLTAVVGAVAAILPLLVQVATAILPPIATVLAAIIPVIAEVVATVVGALIPVVTAIVDLVAALVPVIVSVVEAVLPVVVTAIEGITQVIQGVLGILQGVIDFLVGVFTGNWDQAWQGVQEIFDGVWQAIQGIVDTVTGVIQGVIQGFLDTAKSVWENAWNGIKQFFLDIWEGLKNAAKEGVDNVYSVVTNIKDKITGFFSGAGQWLVDSGRAILNGLKEGIESAVGSVTSAVSGALSKIRGLFPFSPAKWGPFSGHGYTTYSGRALMGDFGKSIAVGAAAAASKARSAMADVRDALEAEPVALAATARVGSDAYSARAYPASSAAGGAGTTYVLNVDGDRTGMSERMKMMLETIFDEMDTTTRMR